jgi:hypothetical protein
MRNYTIVETCTTTTVYTIDADSPEQAEENYLANGDEQSSRTRNSNVDSVELTDADE